MNSSSDSDAIGQHDCSAPSTNTYERIGGVPGIEALVSRLYDIMASQPEAATIWKWHPGDIGEVKRRLTAFLSGWLGGSAVYPELYGPPMMRRRHIAFAIGPKERDIWLGCARAALAGTVPDQALRDHLDEALTAMAEHMRNRDEGGHPEGVSCCSPLPDCRLINGKARARPTRLSGCMRNSNAGSRRKPCCRRPKPQP